VPGILGWGSNETMLRVGREGSWYTWTISTRNEQGISGSSPIAPPEFRRFWETPEKEKP
jgi:hypothetical protein